MSEHEDAAELAAGYALGSLTPEERARYEAYLAQYEQGRLDADDFGRVADALAADAPAATPPADLKARLMAQIAETPQQAPAAPTASGTAAPAAPAATQASAASPAPEAPRVTPAQTRAQRRWFQRPAAILVAAAAAVALFAGGTLLGVSVGNTSSVTAQQADTLAQISASSDAKRATSPVAGGGTATLVWSNALGKSAMVVEGVAPAPNGKTYQLWYIRGGQATSAGLMTEGDWRVLQGTMRAGDTVGITVEPAGGSKQPTTKPVVAIAS